VAAQAAADLAPGGGQLCRLDPEFLFAPRADRVHCCGRCCGRGVAAVATAAFFLAAGLV